MILARLMRWWVFGVMLVLPRLAAAQGYGGEATQYGNYLPRNGSKDMTGDLGLLDDVNVEWGTGDDTVCQWDTQQTPDAMVCDPGDDSRVWWFGKLGADYALAQQTNTTLCVHSEDTATAADRICLAHDQTDGVFSTGAGDLTIQPAGGDIKVALNVKLTLDDDGNENDFVTCTANDNCRFTVGNDPVQSWIGSSRTEINRRLSMAAIIHQDSVPTITLAAAATTFALTRNYNIIDCDAGGNTIATITGDQLGVSFCMLFVDGSCTFTDTDDGAADTIDIPATTTFAADDVLCLLHDGTSWHGRNGAGSINSP